MLLKNSQLFVVIDDDYDDDVDDEKQLGQVERHHDSTS